MNKLFKVIKSNYKYIILASWAIVIFLLSNEPAVVSSGRSDLIVRAISTSFHADLSQQIMTFLVRKSAHITAYFILGVLIFNIIGDYKLKPRYVIFISIGLVSLYAISDEFHQSFVPGRSWELRDVLIDTTAGIVGICLIYLLCKIRYTCLNNKNDV